MVAGAARAGELPAAEPKDTSTPARTFFSASQLPALGTNDQAGPQFLRLDVRHTPNWLPHVTQRPWDAG